MVKTMRKLYEIEADLANLIELDADRFCDGETGEIVSREAFDALQMEWSKKIEGVCLGYKNEKAEADAIKAEIDKLTERKKRHEKRAEGYKNFLQNVLAGQKFETSKAAVSYRTTKDVVNVTNMALLPKEYLRFGDPEPNKIAIKEAIKSGKKVDGAELVDKTSMSVR